MWPKSIAVSTMCMSWFAAMGFCQLQVSLKVSYTQSDVHYALRIITKSECCLMLLAWSCGIKYHVVTYNILCAYCASALYISVVDLLLVKFNLVSFKKDLRVCCALIVVYAALANE